MDAAEGVSATRGQFADDIVHITIKKFSSLDKAIASFDPDSMSQFKRNFFDMYCELLTRIEPKHFEQFSSRVPNEKSLEVYNIVLIQNIMSYFNTVWETTNADEKLSVLEMLRNDPKKTDTKKWRPTGKDAEEQMRPLIMNKLKWQKKMYERQTQHQKERLEHAVARVEMYRKNFAHMQRKREFLKNAITNDMNDFNSIESQISDIEEKIIEDLQRNNDNDHQDEESIKPWMRAQDRRKQNRSIDSEDDFAGFTEDENELRPVF